MFKPKRVLFEKGTLDTEVGQNIYNMIYFYYSSIQTNTTNKCSKGS